MVLRRLSQDSEGRLLSCEIQLPSLRPGHQSAAQSCNTEGGAVSPGSSCRGSSPAGTGLQC